MHACRKKKHSTTLTPPKIYSYMTSWSRN